MLLGGACGTRNRYPAGLTRSSRYPHTGSGSTLGACDCAPGNSHQSAGLSIEGQNCISHCQGLVASKLLNYCPLQEWPEPCSGALHKEGWRERASLLVMKGGHQHNARLLAGDSYLRGYLHEHSRSRALMGREAIMAYLPP